MNYLELKSQLHALCVKEQEIIKRKKELNQAISEYKQQIVDKYNSLLVQLNECKQELDEIGVEIPPSKNKDTISISEEDTIEEATIEVVPPEHDIKKSDVATTKIELSEHNNTKGHLLTPYYYTYGIRSGAYSKNCTIKPWEQDSPRLLTPFHQLTSGPINKVLNMGNQLYRESYKTPDEGRIYSANGIAPTLTATHSDLRICIGTNPHTNEDLVA